MIQRWVFIKAHILGRDAIPCTIANCRPVHSKITIKRIRRGSWNIMKELERAIMEYIVHCNKPGKHFEHFVLASAKAAQIKVCCPLRDKTARIFEVDLNFVMGSRILRLFNYPLTIRAYCVVHRIWREVYFARPGHSAVLYPNSFESLWITE